MPGLVLMPHRMYLLFVPFLQVSLFALCNGQEHGLSFQRFTVDDGLSQGTITAIVQDHQGFMWIGTQDGLNRFDGVEFKTYRHSSQDPGSISSSWITSLYEDRAHNLWVGTLRGLNRFDRWSETFARHYNPHGDSSGPASSHVYAIHESYVDGIPKLWIVMGRLFTFDRQREVFIPIPLKTADPHFDSRILTVFDDREGFLWAGTDSGLIRFDPRNETIGYCHHSGPGVTAIEVSHNGKHETVWFGTSRGLFRLNPETRHVSRHGNFGVSSFFKDTSGQLWIGTSMGLGRLLHADSETPSVEFFQSDPALPNSLSDSYVHCLYEDDSGGLWVGTYNGLNRTAQVSPGFLVYRHRPDNPNSLGHDFVLPIMEDREGSIWFGTFGGGVSVLLKKRSTERFIHLRHNPDKRNGLHGDNVRSLLQDRTGAVWIGTNEGLNILDPTTMSVVQRLPLWNESLAQTRDGTIWAGATKVGLVRIERNQKRWESSATRISQFRSTLYPFDGRRGAGTSEEVHVIVEDRRGALWVGTEVGLVKFNRDSGTYTRYVHKPEDSTSLSDDNVWCIAEDPSEEILWIGTSDGLNRFDGRTGAFRRFLGQDGFPNAYVYGILRDDEDRLWLSTNHGLTRFDDRQPQGRKFKNFTVSDGLQANEFNRHAYCRLRSGEFLFGGTHGVTRFRPMQIQDNPYVPPVVLTAFSKFGKRIRFDRDISDVTTIELNHDENVFAFEFAALNYTNASRNQYAYMMMGFDQDWVKSGSRRYAGYTHLDPGEYVFRVKGSNNDGVWNEHGASVGVRIKPAYWATWWFRGLSSLVVIAGLFILYRQHVRRLEKEKRIQQEFSARLMESQENERKRIAGELHDSLGQNLLVIRNRALLGLKDDALSPHARNQLDQISAVASQSINEVREIAYDLRPYQLDRLGLTKAVASITSALATSVKFSMSIDPIDEEVGNDHAIHVYRIVQEGINNILKHSAATEARVAIRVEGSTLRITISENGKGMPTESTSGSEGQRGLGLVGITERAKVLNGTVAIESTPGQGTILTVLIPRAKRT